MNSERLEQAEQDRLEAVAKIAEQEDAFEYLRNEAIEASAKCVTLQNWLDHTNFYGVDHLQEEVRDFCNDLAKVCKCQNKALVNTLLACSVAFQVPVIGPDWSLFTATITLEKAVAVINGDYELALTVGNTAISFETDTRQALKILLTLSV